MPHIHVPDASQLPVTWVKSSYSGQSGQCVEAAPHHGRVAVRDSKNPTGPATLVGRANWLRFIEGVRGGHL